MNKSLFIRITGLVQGVGFRPFIYRLALRFGINGSVENTNEGVLVKAQGDSRKLDRFIGSIRTEAPSASHIVSISTEEVPFKIIQGFSIIKSRNLSDSITEISPDIAVCDECLSDMEKQANRIHYPFINCTHCGPRFSIIRDLPYDREKTTMQVFPMCASCHAEYSDINDRRFHAQPVACHDCGPEYTLYKGKKAIKGIDAIIEQISEMIGSGKIIAVKGIGGFQIACDAMDYPTVARLRKLKSREGKPFAVMFSSLQVLQKYAFTGDMEINSLTSPKRPIVLLESRKPPLLAENVTQGLRTIGAMLPYMPLHHLLFRNLDCQAIVLTSGNLSDEPILVNNEDASEKFTSLTDGILVYNREIENRTDDSVVRIIHEKERVFRRSRGYAPSPIHLNLDTEGIIATGGELVNCFCIGKGKMAMLSQHIGDIKNVETSDFFVETMEKLVRIFRVSPSLLVSDMHPQYFTTTFAEENPYGVPSLKVQHHHAHIASCMAEFGLDEKVIGVAMDGTGYGDDGHIWGAEFFICDLNGYKRMTHFNYVPLPGGDKAVEEPWRMGIVYLHSAFGEPYSELDIPFIRSLDKAKAGMILKMIGSGLNSPLVSSTGRLFDAVAAIMNICQVSTFQAEAPMRLESLTDPTIRSKYDCDIHETIDFTGTIREIVNDIRGRTDPHIISTKFHNTIISVIFEVVSRIGNGNTLRKVILSGGTFQNKFLLEGVERKLLEEGYKVYSHEKVPTNDGGIALGQLAIASKRRELKCV